MSMVLPPAHDKLVADGAQIVSFWHMDRITRDISMSWQLTCPNRIIHGSYGVWIDGMQIAIHTDHM